MAEVTLRFRGGDYRYSVILIRDADDYGIFWWWSDPLGWKVIDGRWSERRDGLWQAHG